MVLVARNAIGGVCVQQPSWALGILIYSTYRTWSSRVPVKHVLCDLLAPLRFMSCPMHEGPHKAVVSGPHGVATLCDLPALPLSAWATRGGFALAMTPGPPRSGLSGNPAISHGPHQLPGTSWYIVGAYAAGKNPPGKSPALFWAERGVGVIRQETVTYSFQPFYMRQPRSKTGMRGRARHSGACHAQPSMCPFAPVAYGMPSVI